MEDLSLTKEEAVEAIDGLLRRGVIYNDGKNLRVVP